MASWQARQRDPLLDQGTQAMLERRGRELIGLGLFAVSLLFCLMLGSYSPEDPGWMVSTQEPARNMLGRFGAAVSSTLIILIGRGAWVLPLLFAAWGARFVLHKGADRVLSRAVFAVIAVAIAAAFASILPKSASWGHSFGMGGLFGDTVAAALLGLIPGQGTFGLALAGFGSFAGLLAMLLYVTGFDRREIGAIVTRLRYGSAMGLHKVAGGIGKGAASSAKLTARMGANVTASAAAASARVMAERRNPPLSQDYRLQEELPLRGGKSLREEDMPLVEDRFEPDAFEPPPLVVPQARKVVRRAPEPVYEPAYEAEAYDEPLDDAYVYEGREDYGFDEPAPAVLRAEPRPELRPELRPEPSPELRAQPMVSSLDPRPAPLSAQQGYSAPASLRAEPRQFVPEPPKEKQGFFARILRGPEPEQQPLPEIVAPILSAEAEALEPPHADRIKARISDVVRTRGQGGSSARARSGLSPLQAAIASRRPEPPMKRARRPAPLIADTRPNTLPPNSLPKVAPPLVAEPQGPEADYAQAMQDYAPLGDYDQPLAENIGQVAEYEQDHDYMLPPEPQPKVQQAAPRRVQGFSGNLAEGLGDDLDDGPINLFADDDDDWAPKRPRVSPPLSPAPVAAPSVAPPRVQAPMVRSAAPQSAQDWEDADEEFDDYVAPAVAPRAVSVPRPAPQPERRATVQPAVKKPILPSARAKAEAQPMLRFAEPEGPAYELPPLALLSAPTGDTGHHLSDEALEENARMLETVLDDYGVKGEIVSVRPGPVVTMYELEPAPGLKASRVIGLADDIARSMSALSARVSTVPGRTVIGIELPNSFREKVFLREILAAREFGDGQQRLPLALGKDIGGDPIVANLAKMPHLLIAGTTGSGKSVAINTMILSLLYKLTPEECRMIMIDPKMLELSVYDGIPHLLSPVVTDPKKAVVALKWVVGEMEDRYRKMSKMGVRNIDGYNGRVREAIATGEMFKRTIQTGFDDETGDPVFETEEFAPQPFPYIVVIVDEMADLMMVAGKEIEACIQRLAQMARASGIHLIMATQRPSVDVITGTIKANFPTRISFQVTSKIDSRTILGEQGAEQLLGQGDMLYMGNGQRITRIHGPFVSDEEVEEIVTHLKSFGPPTYMSGVVDGPDDDKADDIDAVLGLGNSGNSDNEDSLYDQAVAIVARDRKCSTSYIQRKLGIGYNKAARLVEQMEDQGIVTAANHVGKREILIPEQ